ncbi:hypothetical protein [Prauserella rugosa]|uniref:Excreted virulence factor EspC (Type VII ESX diderm) n=1 Tax=Prauserella rugosa TaxID=43354 RepID=A0A660CJ19_9PSEU|nr:hypothetical protein [Prauserella rugosa]KMS88762.1 hypothetical protein ACZ91_24010 [Streptomyces regensis]TWH22424.1 hypothetical protein JD82_04305 [Prauserella rugosa]
MSGGGYSADDLQAFDDFGKKLSSLSDDVRGVGELVRGMAVDPGLFGILAGQIIGAAASDACRSAGDAIEDYGKTLEKHKDKLDKAKQTYEAEEEDVKAALSRYQL